jgi:hypothetical protein
MTNTFTGIRPADVAGFISAQFLGAFAATLLFQWLTPQRNQPFVAGKDYFFRDFYSAKQHVKPPASPKIQQPKPHQHLAKKK